MARSAAALCVRQLPFLNVFKVFLQGKERCAQSPAPVR
jgi:hypothetical protein